MFVQRVQGQQSPLRKQLRMIAELAHYQPIPSIPAPSMGFNYTLSRQRYSDYQTPRVIKKEKNISGIKSEDLKLSTILQTQKSNHIFPRIANPPRKQLYSFRKVQRLPTHFRKDHLQTQATRQRSLTYDSPMTNQEEKLISIEYRDEQPFLTYEKQKETIQPTIEPRYKQRASYKYQLQEECQSDTEDQFEKDAVPGPGAYTYSYSDFDKKSIGKKSTKASFVAQSTRFPQIKPSIQPSIPIMSDLQIQKEKRRQQKLKLKKNKKQLVSFNSRSPRSSQSDINAKNRSPGPQDYAPRYGIQQELIKKIQRHFKGNFGSGQQRFQYQKEDNLHLGPGSYQLPNISESLQGQNFYFKSKKQRF